MNVSTKAGVEEYDLVILGGGMGGTVVAWTFAAQGQRVAVVERKYIGGSCGLARLLKRIGSEAIRTR
jgi:flavin-dependent dehydrogenase